MGIGIITFSCRTNSAYFCLLKEIWHLFKFPLQSQEKGSLLIKYKESTRANMKDLVAFSYKAAIPKAIQEMTVFVPPSSVDK